MRTPGIYLESTEAAVPFMEALGAWAPVAHEVLVETAGRYQGLITNAELSTIVQERTGIRTTMLLPNWIGKLLVRVGALSRQNGEPLLTALCVDIAQRPGPGYEDAVRESGEPVPEDPDQHAAEQRLLCYRRWAADLPADGGEATLTPKVLAHRNRPSHRAPVTAETPVLCPDCFTVLPKTGTCSYC